MTRDEALRADIPAAAVRLEARLKAIESRLDRLGDEYGEIWRVLGEIDDVTVQDLRERVELLERLRRVA